jgi:hypothetical protein
MQATSQGESLVNPAAYGRDRTKGVSHFLKLKGSPCQFDVAIIVF